LRKTWRSSRVEDHSNLCVVGELTNTHGQHKAATILALEALEQIPESRRPAVFGALASPKDTGSYATLSGHPITAATSPKPQFHCDRDVHFGFHNALSYQIVVDWVIAEHKSQGLFQTTIGQDRFENFWVFTASGGPAVKMASALFAEISAKPHTAESAAETAPK
jgi:N-acetylglucosamine malate deacetylase 2